MAQFLGQKYLFRPAGFQAPHVVRVQVGDGQGIDLVQAELHFAGIMRQGRAFGTETDIEEQGAPVRAEEVGHPGITVKTIGGFLFHQDGQLKKIEFRQIEGFGLPQAVSVAFRHRFEIFLIALIFAKQKRKDQRRRHTQKGPP